MYGGHLGNMQIRSHGTCQNFNPLISEIVSFDFFMGHLFPYAFVTLCFVLFCFVVLPCVLHLPRCGIIKRHDKLPCFKPGLQCCCTLHQEFDKGKGLIECSSTYERYSPSSLLLKCLSSRVFLINIANSI